jgi:hypothetical protein
MADSLEIVGPQPGFSKTATQWLVSHALELLNSEEKTAERDYAHVTELLRGRDDLVETLFGLYQSANAEDIGLRWSALYVVGDLGGASAADPLFRVAAESLPESCKERDSCEGPADGEILVRTMAVEALHRVAQRHEDVRDRVLKLVAARPERAVLVEAVKAARDLGMVDELKEALRKKDRWMLELKTVPVTEVVAEPERDDTEPTRLVAPNLTVTRQSPKADCCEEKRRD